MFALTSFAMGIIWLILGLSGTQNFPPPLPPKTETELFIKMKQGDDAARTRLIEHNLRLVAHIVRKYYFTSKNQDDLISIGSIGLVKAIDSFDCANGARFATYGAKCIQNAILSRMRLWFQTSIPRAEKNRDGVFWHRYPRICISFALLWTAA